MDLHNGGRQDWNPKGVVPPDPVGDMAAHDRLPPEARRLIDEAPVKLSSKDALRLYRKEGKKRLIAEIEETIRLARDA